MSRQSLHLLVRPNDELAQEIIRAEQASPGLVVTVRDLTVPEPDYLQLLADVFTADSVAVW